MSRAAIASLFIPCLASARPALDAPPKRIDRLRAAIGAALPNPNFSPAPAAILTPRFVYVRDSNLELPVPPWQTDAAYAEAFQIARRAWYSVQPDGARALMVFTSFDEGGDTLFYVPAANDVEGIGVPIFDDTPDQTLDGYIWMGSVEALVEAGDAYFREAFLHEIAHRWTAYVDVDHPALAADQLRGRQSKHWSFFADTARSPMEGNDWIPSGRNVTTDLSNASRVTFSPSDLYLMGVLAPEDVPPFEIVVGHSAVTPSWLTPAPDTTPAHRLGEVVTLYDATRVRVGIDDVIRANGPRDPPAVDAMTWRIGIVYLSDGFSTPTLGELAALDARIAALAGELHEATGGRVTLDVGVEGAGTLAEGSPCTSVAECDRTRSDACASPLGGGEICTRACETAEVCGSGECCYRGLCAPSAACETANASRDGGPASIPDPRAGPGLEPADPTCGCRAAADSSSPLAIVIVAILWAIRPGRSCSSRS